MWWTFSFMQLKTKRKKPMKKVRFHFIQMFCTIFKAKVFAITHFGILNNFLVYSGPKVTYIPPTLPEDEDSIFAHYETGINFDKYDDITVEVSGVNPPQAILVRKHGDHDTISFSGIGDSTGIVCSI